MSLRTVVLVVFTSAAALAFEWPPTPASMHAAGFDRGAVPRVWFIQPTARAMQPPVAERGEWDDLYWETDRVCARFPSAYYAMRGDVKVTKVEGKSEIKPGDTQAILTGSFRVDQYIPERKRFGCDMVLQWDANEIRGTVSANKAFLNQSVKGRLTEAELTLEEQGLRVRIVGVTTGQARITREGVLQAIPMGIKMEEEFNAFADTMGRYVSQVIAKFSTEAPPLRGVHVTVMGSAVKGRSAGRQDDDGNWIKPPGIPFDGKDEPSDIDMNLTSLALFKEGVRLGCKPKQTFHRGILRLAENCEFLEDRPRESARSRDTSECLPTKKGGHVELCQMREELSRLIAHNVPARFKGAKRPVNYVVLNGIPSPLAHIGVPIFGLQGGTCAQIGGTYVGALVVTTSAGPIPIGQKVTVAPGAFVVTQSECRVQLRFQANTLIGNASGSKARLERDNATQALAHAELTLEGSDLAATLVTEATSGRIVRVGRLRRQ